MPIWLTLALSVLFLGDADLPRVENLRPANQPDVTFSPADEIPLLPGFTNEQATTQQNTKDAKKSAVLQDQSRFALIRYVSGEFAKVVKPLPSGKDGFQVEVGKHIDDSALQHSVDIHGAAVNTGDQVQITKLEFRAKSIVVDVNGG